MKGIASLSYTKRWLIVATILGVVSGFSALIFYAAIQFMEHIFLSTFVGMVTPHPAGEGGVANFVYAVKNYWFIPVSIIVGGLLSGLIVYRFAPEAEGHGTDAAIHSFHEGKGKIRRRIPLIKGLASAITIGSGGSAGREGPTAQIAAGIGSWFADLMGMSENDRRIAVSVCVGAGIGTIFKAPIGGAILAAEILYKRDLEVEVIYPSIIAGAVGYAIFGSIVGFTPVFGNNVISFNILGLPMYAVLGIVTGLLSIVYIKSFYGIHDRFKKLEISNYMKPVIGAAVVGLLALIFPEIMATGYGWVQIMMNGSLQQIPTFGVPLLIILILLPIVKIVATSFSIGSGGSGGVFAPGLSIGASIGLILFMLFHLISPTVAVVAAPFVIIGMLSFFGAAGKAPIAVLIMVVEMTGSLMVLPGAMVAIMIAYFVSGDYTIYRSQVRTRKDSPVHFEEYNLSILAGIRLREIPMSNISLDVNSTVASARKQMARHNAASLPVISSRKIVGIAYLFDLNESSGKTKVEKVMKREEVSMGLTNSAEEAWGMMARNKTTWMPVVENGRYLGSVTLDSILSEYEKRLERKVSTEKKEAAHGQYTPA